MHVDPAVEWLSLAALVLHQENRRVVRAPLITAKMVAALRMGFLRNDLITSVCVDGSVGGVARGGPRTGREGVVAAILDGHVRFAAARQLVREQALAGDAKLPVCQLPAAVRRTPGWDARRVSAVLHQGMIHTAGDAYRPRYLHFPSRAWQRLGLGGATDNTVAAKVALVLADLAAHGKATPWVDAVLVGEVATAVELRVSVLTEVVHLSAAEGEDASMAVLWGTRCLHRLAV